MKCKWCKGTYDECGCGNGHCVHCDHGQVADPPFGDAVYLDGDYDDIRCVDFEDHWYIPDVCVESSIQLVGENILTEEEIQKFSDYWVNPYRDETRGTVQLRIESYILEKVFKTGINSLRR